MSMSKLQLGQKLKKILFYFVFFSSVRLKQMNCIEKLYLQTCVWLRTIIPALLIINLLVLLEFLLLIYFWSAFLHFSCRIWRYFKVECKEELEFISIEFIFFGRWADALYFFLKKNTIVYENKGFLKEKELFSSCRYIRKKLQNLDCALWIWSPMSPIQEYIREKA